MKYEEFKSLLGRIATAERKYRYRLYALAIALGLVIGLVLKYCVKFEDSKPKEIIYDNLGFPQKSE